jgi:hypothetical protein
MESIDNASTLDDEGGNALDADRCGPQHAVHRGSGAETVPEGKGRSAWQLSFAAYPDSWSFGFDRIRIEAATLFDALSSR